MPKLPIAEFEEAVHEALSDLGFVRGRGVYQMPLGDWAGGVGLNRMTAYGSLDVHPFVGVAHVPTLALLDAAYRQVDRRIRPRWGQRIEPLSELINTAVGRNDVIYWKFAPDEDVRPRVREMVSAIERFGIPFIKKSRTINGFVDEVRAVGSSLSDPEIPALLIAAGRVDEASVALAQAVARHAGGQSDEERWWSMYAAALAERTGVRPQ